MSYHYGNCFLSSVLYENNEHLLFYGQYMHFLLGNNTSVMLACLTFDPLPAVSDPGTVERAAQKRKVPSPPHSSNGHSPAETSPSPVKKKKKPGAVSSSKDQVRPPPPCFSVLTLLCFQRLLDFCYTEIYPTKKPVYNIFCSSCLLVCHGTILCLRFIFSYSVTLSLYDLILCNKIYLNNCFIVFICLFYKFCLLKSSDW